ncbi:hypothetical protein AVEN_160413-1 [Araneus ventricosus]|uniref:Uncharacterized protein n=1 Tax=Araneus ventricosus TaxID=182803 RepID=A0A4Y2WVY8_ARAVE|nr:hypothetical protein AVEN_241707-1 [Araneus ventricosus]GBO41001.1 hypothetical protein AVEN_160413-1 [Araneus ventricosus]
MNLVMFRRRMTRTTPELSPPLSKLRTTPTGGRLATTYDLTCSRPIYMVDLQWNRVSNPEPSGPEVETLPLDLRGALAMEERLTYDGFIVPFRLP